MRSSDRRILRSLAAEARAVLLEPADRPCELDAAEARAAAMDTWLLLISAVALNGSLERIDEGWDRLNALLAQLLGRGVRELCQPARSDATTTLLKRMCSDDLSPIWREVQSLGWAYQYFIEPDLQPFRSSGGAKVGEDHLSIRTQQFTDRWIAEFLVHNTLGRLWLEMHPDTRLAGRWRYLVPRLAGPSPPAVERVREITILDPACGTMNFGLCAFDLLVEMYREELARAGQAGWPDPPSVTRDEEIPHAILQDNLFGVDIDPRPLVLSAVALFIRAGMPNAPTALNLACGDTLKRDLFAETSRAGNLLARRYDVVLLNPPYLDRRDYTRSIGTFMKRAYPLGGRNFYTAFLERSLELVKPGGRLGAVTPQTFMFISSLERLRRWLAGGTTIETLVHTGLNTFADAVVDCAFYVLRRDESDRADRPAGHFFRLTDLKDPSSMARRLAGLIGKLGAAGSRFDGVRGRVYMTSQADFEHLPGRPWVYWLTPNLRAVFDDLPTLGDLAAVKQGLATTDNFRFVRFWWEIPERQIARRCRSIAQAKRSGKTWFPYAKGGGFRKWYGLAEHVVNWAEDGEAIKGEILRRYPYLKGKWRWVAKNTERYFRPGLTYSYLTSRQFSARVLRAGFIFDVAGSAVFGGDPALILAILNSRMCRFLLGLINATVNFQIGDLARLPIPATGSASLRKRVERAVCLARLQETFEETSPDFVAPLPWPTGVDVAGDIKSKLATIQSEIDDEVYRLYGLGPKERAAVEKEMRDDPATRAYDRSELAFRWISYAVGLLFGRFAPGKTSAPGGGVYRADDFNLTDVAKLSRAGLKKLLAEHHCLAWTDQRGQFHRFDRRVELELSRIKVGEQAGGIPIDVMAAGIEQVVSAIFGPAEAVRLIQSAAPDGDLGGYLTRTFFKKHLTQYRKRPLYWVLKGEANTEGTILYYHHLGDGVDRNDGVVLNILPYRQSLADPQYRRWLAPHWQRLVAGTYSWSSLAQRNKRRG